MSRQPGADFWEELERAGIKTDPTRRTLRRRLPMETAPLVVPRCVELVPAGDWQEWDVQQMKYDGLANSADDARLKWTWQPEDEPWEMTPFGFPAGKGRVVGSLDGVLDDFVKIAEAAPDAAAERVLRFARRWGPLLLCRHFLPASHDPGCEVFTRLADYKGVEPLPVWLFFARQARAILRVAAALHSDRAADEPEITALIEEVPEYLRPPYKETFSAADDFWPEAYDFAMSANLSQDEVNESPPGQKALVKTMIEWWLFKGGVRPSFGWSETASTVRLGAYGTFGHLALQLTFAAARSSGEPISLCFHCGEPVENRRVRRGSRVICDKEDCRRAAARAWKNDQRTGVARKRGPRTPRGGSDG